MAEIHITGRPDAVPAARGSILDAALKAGVPFPHACRAGECGRCKCRLVHGAVTHDPWAPEALSAEERAQGLILACRARPQGDVEVAWLDEPAGPLPPMRSVRGVVTEVAPATHDIVRLQVRVEDDPVDFIPGQFARLAFPGLPPRAYSMANLPGAEVLEFHVRRVPGGRVSSHVAEAVRAGDRIRLEGPCGAAGLRPTARSRALLVAGGSGLAPVLSILRALLARDDGRAIHLYHGVRDEPDLYETPWLEGLAAAGRITYQPVLSGAVLPTARRRGLVHQAVGEDFASLADADIYVCGPPPMVDSVRATALGRGAQADAIQADAFHAAPAEARPGLLGRLFGWRG